MGDLGFESLQTFVPPRKKRFYRGVVLRIGSRRAFRPGWMGEGFERQRGPPDGVG